MVLVCSIRGRGRLVAFKEFRLRNGTIIGVFQGSYGNNPDLDIVVKYQERGKRVRTPKHIHWAIDLLIKKEHRAELVKALVHYLIAMWDEIEPFSTKADQQRCELRFTNPENLAAYEELDNYGEYPVEFIGHVIELMMLEEKTGNHDAFMFKGVLEAIRDDKEIFEIVSRATYTG